MSKTKVQIEVKSVEGEKAQFRINVDGKLLISFELAKDQMLSVFNYLTKQIVNGESGGSTLIFDKQTEDK